MKIKTLLFFISLLIFSQTIFSQKKEIKLPTHPDGNPIFCEKFDLLEKMLPYVLDQNNFNNNTITNSDSPQITTSIRTDEDVRIGDAGESEFEIHAAVNPFDSSNIVVGAMNISTSGGSPSLKFSIYYTNDFGTTWSKSPFDGTLPNESVIGGGDPMITFDENGDVLFTWILLTINATDQLGRWGMYLAKSTNNGANWIVSANPIELDTFTNFINLGDLDHAVDKQWMVTDHSPTSDFTGNIYLAYVDIETMTGTYNMKVKRRLPGNDFFENESVIISTQNYALAQFASVDVGMDGTVYATFFADTGNGNYGIYLAKSIDGGATFSTEQKISNIAFPKLFSGNFSIEGIDDNRIYPCPHVVVDPADPAKVYATWTAFGIDSQVSNGMDIYLSRSEDGGDSWSIPMVVNDDTDDEIHQFYSSIAVNQEGVVFVSWYDQRDKNGTADTNFFMGYSTDGGVVFEQKNVTTLASDFSQISESNVGIGPGEYNQIITVGNYTIPFWGDGRTNDGQIMVYAAFLNVFEEEEIISITTQFSLEGPKVNPVKNAAVFELILKEPSDVNVLLFDILGREIKSISGQGFDAGRHTIKMEVDELPVGEYFLKVHTDFGFKTKKIIVMR
ncbi:MAG: hypothetical protein ACJAT4_001650 [Granulosicoccus sp.]|jgi:hypothetical protein